ncbi:hypothetical protein HOH45_00145 [bacterium]|jgi:hypothetical protein|nr:hypothetical protein [bacterium]
MQSIKTSNKLATQCFIILFTTWICSTSITSNTEFSRNVFDASISAIGGASIGKKDLPSSIFYNWAAPSNKTMSIMFQSGSILDAPYLVSAGELNLIVPFRIAYLSQTDSNIPESIINDLGIPEMTNETMTQSFQELLVSFSHNVMGIDVGWLLDYSFESLHKETGQAISLGVALRKEFQFLGITGGVGVSTRDLISGGQVWTTGLTEVISPFTAVALDIFLTKDIHVVTGLKISNEYPLIYSFGSEYSVYQSPAATVIARAGLETENLRLGLGLNFQGYLLNYAYSMQNYSFIENEHQVSFQLNLNKFQQVFNKNSHQKTNTFQHLNTPTSQKYKVGFKNTESPQSSSLFNNTISSLKNQKTAIPTKRLSPEFYSLKQAPEKNLLPSVAPPTLVFSALLSKTKNSQKLKIEEFNSIETKNINNENDQLIKKRTYPVPFLLDFTFNKKRYSFEVSTTKTGYTIISGSLSKGAKILVQNEILPLKSNQLFKKFKLEETPVSILIFFE